MSSLANDPALHLALRDLIRTQAPGATLLATVGQQVVNVRADEATSAAPGTELVPPDEWLLRGDLTWITHDGALLGLLWSEGAPVPPGALHVLTLLLSAASAGGANREAEMLITQLPAPTAWLSAELTFRQVSRTFLELYQLTGAEVIGKSLREVLPEQPAIAEQLELAAAGRAVRLGDVQLSGARWVRGEAKPYFGGAAAGVLWTSQDVSPECSRAGELAALLDTDAPVALLNHDGRVKQASRGLNALLKKQSDFSGEGLIFWQWPCFTERAAQQLQELTQAALAGEAAQAEITLGQNLILSLGARRSALAPGTVLIEGPQLLGSSDDKGVVSQVLSLSDAATVLFDQAGRVQYVSEQAVKLLDLEGQHFIGLSFTRLADQLGLKIYTPDGKAIGVPNLKAFKLPLTSELILGLAGCNTRHVEVDLTAVEENATGKKPSILLTLRDLTQLRRTQAKLRHDAVHDPLTGLLNRAGLRQTLLELGSGNFSGAAAGDNSSGGMVACLDLDSFGSLNAALGRTAGDLLLIQVAARLNDLTTETGGRAARLADDTFAVYLPLSAEAGAEKLRLLWQEPLRAGRRQVPVIFTTGTAELLPSQLEQGLTDADMALQHAKRRGRGITQQFNASLRSEEAQTFELEADLQQALGAGQFTLLYQPAISLKDGRAVSGEALLRWTHPQLGNVPPARFLPLARRTDLITSLGEWVIKEAGRSRALIRETTEQTDWRTSVNLSLEEIRRPGAAQRLLPLMSKRNALDIEVSAGSLIDHSSETLDVLESLRSKGSRLIVDDFGDSASSLTALTDFPLNGVKLHPTLTQRLPDDKMSTKLVEGTIRLAHSLGLAVTAVGVETYAQLDVLRDLGCDAAQGYALTPPLSVDDLSVWLRSRARH